MGVRPRYSVPVIPCTLGLILVCTLTLHAQTAVEHPAAATALPRQVLAAGACAAAGSSYSMRATLGQPLVSVSTGGAASGRFGFWFGIAGMPTGLNDETRAVSTMNLHFDIYPNPCVTTAQMEWTLESEATVSLAIYDASGSMIWHNTHTSRSGGRHTVLWDGRDDAGHAVGYGWYLAVLAVTPSHAGNVYGAQQFRAMKVLQRLR